MKKALDFSTYKKLQKLSLNDTNRWINALYAQAYDDGKNENPILDECVAAMTEERLLEIILSVKGIGQKRAEQLLSKILEEGISYGIKT